MMKKNNYLIGGVLAVLALIFLSVGGFLLYQKYKDGQEGFGSYASNSVGHSGGFDYKRLGKEMNETAGEPIVSSSVVGQGNHPLANPNHVSNVERMTRDSMTSMMPTVANNVVPFDVSVADPNTYLFRTQLPAIQILTRQAREADVYRGDIPITYHPDIPLIEKSRFDRDAIRHDGFFSDAFAKSYAQYSNSAFINKPQYVSNGGTIMS